MTKKVTLNYDFLAVSIFVFLASCGYNVYQNFQFQELFAEHVDLQWTAQNAEALATSAHTLKGMLSNFCAPSAEGAARDLEMRGRENRLEDCDAAVTTLADELKRLRTELQAFLEAQQS